MLTNFCGELHDTLISPDDFFAEQELLDGDLRLYSFRELVHALYGPILTMERYDSIVGMPRHSIDELCVSNT